MNEAERSDKAARRNTAKARLARSRPYRDAAAATHAATLRSLAPASANDGTPLRGDTTGLSTVEAKVLDAAGDILNARGGRALAEQIEAFVAAHAATPTR